MPSKGNLNPPGDMVVKREEEKTILRTGGEKLAKVLASVAKEARPDISTLELDKYAEGLIISAGGAPAFKGYRIKGVSRPYPGTLCVSVNDEIVHAIPRKDKILYEGDIVGIDIGMRWPRQGGVQLYTDMAVTIGVGEAAKEARRLVAVTEKALEIGISEVAPGKFIGDIGYSIHKYLSGEGLGVIRDLAGHGIGYRLHEEPLIPNFGVRGQGGKIVEGMVIAIEPMATLGGWQIFLDKDQWTFRTVDKSLAAHFEHTVLVTSTGAEVLTSL